MSGTADVDADKAAHPLSFECEWQRFICFVGNVVQCQKCKPGGEHVHLDLYRLTEAIFK